MSILEVKKLGINFGGLRAVDNFDLSIENKELVGLIGPNGAGKTTIFNLLTGVYQPNDGEILLAGTSIKNKAPNKIAAVGVARTFQNIRLFNNLSVENNIKIALHNQVNYSILDSLLRNKKYSQQEKWMSDEVLRILDIFDLKGFAKAKARSLPYGKQRELEIARALATSPKLLLLDEPAAGMNPQETKELMAIIKKIRDKFNCSILLIEHDMKLVMGVCERITVLNYGRVLASGTPSEIQANPQVIKAYLGE
ncbi:MAG: ABC transporter ATP-binding protein [Anaerorhabdus sp.]